MLFRSRLPQGLPAGWAKSAKPAPRGGECRSSGFGVVGSQSTGRAPERKVISNKLSCEPTGGGDNRRRGGMSKVVGLKAILGPPRSLADLVGSGGKGGLFIPSFHLTQNGRARLGGGAGGGGKAGP